ncbi:hypothetical protein TRICHSKD4_3118 [Roseibium sp. TrichSKD4]|nr:hypothetical protein TRICHSKD4_3118 [Roseibium sp. TrichSKD4]
MVNALFPAVAKSENPTCNTRNSIAFIRTTQTHQLAAPLRTPYGSASKQPNK